MHAVSDAAAVRRRILQAVAVAVVGLIGFNGCARQSPDEATVEQWVRDSTAYESELRVYLRDSTVLDSLSRLVPLDSLDRLYSAIERSPQSMPLKEAAVCEVLRLGRLHGAMPLRLAMARLRERRGPVAAISRPGGEVLTAGRNCVLPEAGVADAGSTSLHYSPVRPMLAPRPW